MESFKSVMLCSYKILVTLIYTCLVIGVILLSKYAMDWWIDWLVPFIESLSVNNLNLIFEFLVNGILMKLLDLLTFFATFAIPVAVGSILIFLLSLLYNFAIFGTHELSLNLCVIFTLIYILFILFGPKINMLGSDISSMWKSSIFYSFGEIFMKLGGLKDFFSTISGFFKGIGILLAFLLLDIPFNLLLVLILICFCGYLGYLIYEKLFG